MAVDFTSTTPGATQVVNGRTYTLTDGAWRAESAASAVAATITDGDTTHAPSGDAVFDALAGKLPYVPSAGRSFMGSGAYTSLPSTVTFGFTGAGVRVGVWDEAGAAGIFLSALGGRIFSYDYAGGAYKPFQFEGVPITFNLGATQAFRFDTDGFFPLIDGAYNMGRSALRFDSGYIKTLRPGAGSAIWTSGTGTPEGVVVAPVGSMYTRTDGGAGTTLYIKESGAGNTGWSAK